MSRSPTRKHWLPGVWPGVWTRVTGTPPTWRTSPPSWVTSSPAATPVDRATHGASCGLDVDRDRGHLEQAGDALDAPTHQVPTDVVGVEVGGQRADTAHAVGGEHPEEVVHAVCRVDDDRLPGLPVAHQVDEVDHLTGHRIAGREVPAREELAEVQAVGCSGGGGHSPTLRVPRGPDRGAGYDPRNRDRRGGHAMSDQRSPAGDPRHRVGRGHAPALGDRPARRADAHPGRAEHDLGIDVHGGHAGGERPGRHRGRARGSGGLPRPQRHRVLRGAVRLRADGGGQRGRQLAPRPGRDGSGPRGRRGHGALPRRRLLRRGQGDGSAGHDRPPLGTARRVRRLAGQHSPAAPHGPRVRARAGGRGDPALHVGDHRAAQGRDDLGRQHGDHPGRGRRGLPHRRGHRVDGGHAAVPHRGDRLGPLGDVPWRALGHRAGPRPRRHPAPSSRSTASPRPSSCPRS